MCIRDRNYTLFNTIIPDATEKLITLCDEHGVTYTKPYQPPVSPILTFMVSYILPTVLMVGAFMLLMNFITKKSGGMGAVSYTHLIHERHTGHDQHLTRQLLSFDSG